MTSVRLLGPDLPTPLTIAVETNQTIAQLKELALTALRPIRTEAGADVPVVGQLKIIHQGRFPPDDKTLKDCKVTEGDTTAMHLIIKTTVSKPAETLHLSDDKAPKCGCVVC